MRGQPEWRHRVWRMVTIVLLLNYLIQFIVAEDHKQSSVSNLYVQLQTLVIIVLRNRTLY